MVCYACYATLIRIASISVTLTKVGMASKDSVTVEAGLTIKIPF